MYPFAIALLFGNATAWLPLLFGLGILALTRPGGRTAALAGIALAIGTAVKIHPASVGLWRLVTCSGTVVADPPERSSSSPSPRAFSP